MKDGSFNLSWSAVSGAKTYSVLASDSPDGPFRTLATGITTPAYSGIEAPIGNSYYVIRASSSNGDGPASIPLLVAVEKPSATGRMH